MSGALYVYIHPRAEDDIDRLSRVLFMVPGLAFL
jgi:hypothetical protein